GAVVFSAEEQRRYGVGLEARGAREVVSLTLVGEWKDAAAGDKILVEGEPVSRICVAISGRADVHKQGQRIGTLEPGYLIGTAVALMAAASPVAAAFTQPSRYTSLAAS